MDLDEKLGYEGSDLILLEVEEILDGMLVEPEARTNPNQQERHR